MRAKFVNESNIIAQDLEMALKNHDWYYQMSDDNRVYTNGRNELDKIYALMKEVPENIAKYLWTKYSPKSQKKGPSFSFPEHLYQEKEKNTEDQKTKIEKNYKIGDRVLFDISPSTRAIGTIIDYLEPHYNKSLDILYAQYLIKIEKSQDNSLQLEDEVKVKDFDIKDKK